MIRSEEAWLWGAGGGVEGCRGHRPWLLRMGEEVGEGDLLAGTEGGGQKAPGPRRRMEVVAAEAPPPSLHCCPWTS